MWVVAVGELAGRIEEHAAALGALVGLTAFDVKSRLAAPLPRILLQADSAEEASAALRALRAQGHGGLVLDTAELPRPGDLVRVRRFTIDDEGLLADGPRSPRLAWDDVAAVIAVALRTAVRRSTRETELVPAGARPPVTVEREHQAHEKVVERAVYLVPRRAGAARPRLWLVHEMEARYLGLGRAMRPTRRENFDATVALVRARATRAVHDDRYVAQPYAGRGLVEVRGNASADAPRSDGALELLVQILADWLLGGGPYR
jgi:hypothetical protein